VGAAQRHESGRELEQLAVEVLPVEPRRRAVLAVRVVVAALGAAQLVAAEDHGDAEGEQQHREQGTRLPAA
jgi:hypothetical protein